MTALTVLSGCGGDDAAPTTTTTAPSTTVEAAPATTEPPACDDLAEAYLDTFFALGAGTPEDADATTVELPVADLLAIDLRAREAGCRDFVDVACSAYAELEAQGLEATNANPPATC